ncbi:hypothetical protein FM036_33010 [Nostoc sp. HG1]|nr:hypothetical protein [Nostoc sp. HG1]
MPRYTSLSDLASQEIVDGHVTENGKAILQASSSELPYILNLADEIDCKSSYVANTGIIENGCEYTVTIEE